MTQYDLLLWGKTQLRTVSTNAYWEAIALLCFTLKTTHTHLISHPRQIIPSYKESHFQNLVQRRLQGEPLAYLMNQCEFWSLTLTVSPDCLIPRPETECLVTKILDKHPNNRPIQLVDLGTGSGAIALAIASERPAWSIVATDKSLEALNIAKHNAQRLGLRNIKFQQGDWLKALSSTQKFDIIVSNPPYIKAGDPHLKTALRYEPEIALVGGLQGEEALLHLIQEAPVYLLSGGQIWLEQGYNQAIQVAAYLQQYGYTDIQQYPDSAGILRISSGVHRRSL
jgi:release factor glutamine methyltransferase